MLLFSKVAVGRLSHVNIFGNDYETPDGTGVRDYIHVMDLAKGHVFALQKLMEQNLTGFHPINLGTGRGYSVLEVNIEIQFYDPFERNSNFLSFYRDS